MTKEEVIQLYQLLEANAIPSWIIGGWGIDALLGEQTRTHKDLDLLVLVDDLERFFSLLVQEGFHQAYLWEENRFVQNREGAAVATASVWQDGAGREIDMHAMWLDEQGNGIPAWQVKEGFQFPQKDLAGRGTIDGVEVRCTTPEMQLIGHTGYELPETHRKDVERIRDRFGIQPPQS